MSDRLSNITTRTGDQGETSLGDGQRVPKNSLRIHALGEVDELNSLIGVWRCEALPAGIDTLLSHIQHHLFDMGAELCIPGHEAMRDSQLAELDAAILTLNEPLPPLKEFILPGGSRAAALAHQTRTVARRAERSVVSLLQFDGVRPVVQQYLNRLSDLCFILARCLNKHAGQSDVLWQPQSQS